MEIIDTSLRDVKLLHLQSFCDERGWFAEVFNKAAFEAAHLPSNFVQDNQSFSSKGVLRGLHYQLGNAQGKLIRVLSGRIWDVAVDLRRGSPDFGQWVGFDLVPPGESGDIELAWIPEGFAHGFLVLSDTAEVLYKTTAFYDPSAERTIRWNDPTLAIGWPLAQLGVTSLCLSAKDADGTLFAQADLPSVQLTPRKA